jgi:hypothetical protein
MSKIKSPIEKKRLSLARDRRNVFGESPHAARKSIPKRKAIEHQRERHVANQTLGKVHGDSSDEALESIEGEVAARSRSKRLAGFKKVPDQPLAQVIKRKHEKRAALVGRRAKRRVAYQVARRSKASRKD